MSVPRNEQTVRADLFDRTMDRAVDAELELADLRSQLRGAVEALEQIRALWTEPQPAQRQGVAYQEAVQIASRALDRLGGRS